MSKEQQDSCEEEITGKELSLKSVQNDKSPQNYGLSKECYETIWNDVVKPFYWQLKKPIKYNNSALQKDKQL